METTIMGYIGVIWGKIGVISNEEEHGDYHLGLGFRGLGSRAQVG